MEQTQTKYLRVNTSPTIKKIPKIKSLSVVFNLFLKQFTTNVVKALKYTSMNT